MQKPKDRICVRDQGGENEAGRGRDNDGLSVKRRGKDGDLTKEKPAGDIISKLVLAGFRSNIMGPVCKKDGPVTRKGVRCTLLCE